MTDAATVSSIAAVASLIVAFISGGIALRNGSKTSANSLDIQELKGAVDRDLERLRAKLSHGQTISSTQWTAEFGSYRAIWKSLVPVRTLATKIVFREDELISLGLPSDYLASAERGEMRTAVISKLVDAAQDLLIAIHENAPFYPAEIRKAANDTHSAARELIDKQLAALTQFHQGIDVAKNKHFIAESKLALHSIIEGVDLVEVFIRDRLAAVEVVTT